MTEAGGAAGRPASTQRSLDAWAQRDWAPGGQSTVLWTASVERGLDAWAQRSLVPGSQSTVLWTASVERDPATPCRCNPVSSG